jgi:hypothetical protein
VQDKFQQDARRRILHAYNLNRKQNSTRLLIFHVNLNTPQQRQLQTIQVHATVLTEPNRIQTEVRNFFPSFCSANGNKDDIFSNMSSLSLTELTTALRN